MQVSSSYRKLYTSVLRNETNHTHTHTHTHTHILTLVIIIHVNKFVRTSSDIFPQQNVTGYTQFTTTLASTSTIAFSFSDSGVNARESVGP